MRQYKSRIELREKGTCPECGGSGSVPSDDPYEHGNVVCRHCGSTGKYPTPMKYTLNSLIREIEHIVKGNLDGKVDVEILKRLIIKVEEGKKVWPPMRDEL